MVENKRDVSLVRAYEIVRHLDESQQMHWAIMYLKRDTVALLICYLHESPAIVVLDQAWYEAVFGILEKGILRSIPTIEKESDTSISINKRWEPEQNVQMRKTMMVRELLATLQTVDVVTDRQRQQFFVTFDRYETTITKFCGPRVVHHTDPSILTYLHTDLFRDFQLFLTRSRSGSTHFEADLPYGDLRSSTDIRRNTHELFKFALTVLSTHPELDNPNLQPSDSLSWEENVVRSSKLMEMRHTIWEEELP